MLKAVQFHRQLRIGAIKVENVFTQYMLPAKFETCKSPTAQRAPEFSFLGCQLVAEVARDLLDAHGGHMWS